MVKDAYGGKLWVAYPHVFQGTEPEFIHEVTFTISGKAFNFTSPTSKGWPTQWLKQFVVEEYLPAFFVAHRVIEGAEVLLDYYHSVKSEKVFLMVLVIPFDICPF